MITVRRFRAHEHALLRELRLAALADAPHAFCARYEDEARMSAAAWRARAASNAAGVDTAGFWARWRGVPSGLVVGVRSPEDAGAVELNALWVVPDARGRGVARALVEAVCRWAEARRRDRVTLSVMASAVAARSLYARMGFVEIGAPARAPGDGGGTMIAMSRPLDRADAGTP